MTLKFYSSVAEGLISNFREVTGKKLVGVSPFCPNPSSQPSWKMLKPFFVDSWWNVECLTSWFYHGRNHVRLLCPSCSSFLWYLKVTQKNLHFSGKKNNQNMGKYQTYTMVNVDGNWNPIQNKTNQSNNNDWYQLNFSVSGQLWYVLHFRKSFVKFARFWDGVI